MLRTVRVLVAILVLLAVGSVGAVPSAASLRSAGRAQGAAQAPSTQHNIRTPSHEEATPQSEPASTAGSITEFPVPTTDSGPNVIDAGPDGNLWFTETDANQIGRLALGATVFLTNDCVHVRVRPRRIMFACADGNYFVKRLEWSRWRMWRAVGRGVFYLNDCDPNCAEGTFHHRWGKITLRRRLWCPDVGKYVFRRARVVYDRPLLGQTTDRIRLFCPFRE
jgi:hypothetical protein